MTRTPRRGPASKIAALIGLLVFACLLFTAAAEAIGPTDGFYEYAGKYGTDGHNTGEFHFPHGMAFSPNGDYLAVCDTGNNRVVLLKALHPLTLSASRTAHLFSVEKTFGGIWPFEGSLLPIDDSDVYLEKDQSDGMLPGRELKGRPYHGGQARIRPAEAIPMDRFCLPEAVAWLDPMVFLVTDTENHRVKAQRTNGEIAWILGREGWKSGYFHQPLGIALDPSGKLYVTEPRSNFIRGVGVELLQLRRVQGNRLQIFGPDLKPGKRLGDMHHMSGRFEKQFKNPTRVWITGESDVVVSDTGNHRILVYSSDLAFKKALREWPLCRLRYPYGVHTDSEGNMAIADTGNHRILILDRNYELKQIIGKRGIGNGEFSFPREARFGPDGRLYVLDTMNSRIQVFKNPLVDPDPPPPPPTPPTPDPFDIPLEPTVSGTVPLNTAHGNASGPAGISEGPGSPTGKDDFKDLPTFPARQPPAMDRPPVEGTTASPTPDQEWEKVEDFNAGEPAPTASAPIEPPATGKP